MHLLAGSNRCAHHVDQPTAGPGEAILAFARAIEAAEDRDLGRAEPQRALAVVEHELDLGGGRRLAAGSAGEDHILHRLTAHVAR